MEGMGFFENYEGDVDMVFFNFDLIIIGGEMIIELDLI